MGEKLGGKLNNFSRFCAGAVLALTLLYMAFLLPMSFVRTTGMSTGGGRGEVVTFMRDNFFLNVIMLVIFIAAAYILHRAAAHVSVKKLTAALALWVIVFGFAFVCSTKLQPSEDSFTVTFYARQAVRGDCSYYQDYFTAFPFQFGYVLYEELFFRAFALIAPGAPEGFSSLALQGVNVLFTALSYVAIVNCTGLIFKSEDVQRLTALMLAAFLQPVLFSTYMYGNIPGFAFGVLSVWCFLRFDAGKRVADGIFCAVFIALAVVMKLNSLIFFAALIIVWLIRLICRPNLRSLALLALTAALTIGVKDLPQRYYESRAGVSYGGGVPQLGWMAMGLSEGKSCSGWYDTTYTVDAYEDAGFDRDAAEDTARAAISERLAYFAAEPTEARHFFSRKILSQWNEPSYQSLWNNQLRPKYGDTGILYELICVRFADGLSKLMNDYQQLIFFGFTLALALLFRRRDITSALLPLIILGGLMYHTLFEAKSQYAMGYVTLMIPLAAYGIVELTDFFAERGERYGK